MPNITSNNVIIDGTRKGRAVLTGLFDGLSGQEINVFKINTWGLRGALSNASNGLQLLSSALNGSYNRGTYNLVITGIQYSVTSPGTVRLELTGTGPDNTIALLTGSGGLQAARGGDYVFDPGRPGFVNAGHTGNISLSTFGLGANGSYWISIDYEKDPTKFDQGQIARPKDFNIIVSGNNA
jgi:hypothetical protein